MQVAELFASLGLKPIKSEWAAGNELIGGVKKALVALSALAVGRQIYEGIKSVEEYGSTINDTAQKTGIGVGALQELGYVAEQNSSSLDAMSGAVTKLSRGLDEATQKGAGPAADALRRLGISINDPNFKKADLDGKIMMISQGLQKFPDGVQKTALAMDLFGRSGAELIPTLNQLGEEGDEARARFRQLGGELSADQVAALDKYGDTMRDVSLTFEGIKRQVVTALLPALQKLASGFLDWYTANKEIINLAVEKTVDAITTSFAALGAVLTTVFTFLESHRDAALAVVIALAAVIGAVLIPAFIAWAAAQLLALAPWILLVAAVALVAYGILKLVENWSTVVEAVKRGVHRVGQFFVGVGRAIADFYKGIWNRVTDIADGIADAFKATADAIRYVFNAVVDWIADKVKWVEGKVDWVIDKAHQVSNALFGSAGTPGTLESATFAPSGGAGGDSTAVTNVNAGGVTVNVNGAGDSKDVAEQVRRTVQEHWDGQMRDAHAATGGADQ